MCELESMIVDMKKAEEDVAAAAKALLECDLEIARCELAISQLDLRHAQRVLAIEKKYGHRIGFALGMAAGMALASSGMFLAYLLS